MSEMQLIKLADVQAKIVGEVQTSALLNDEICVLFVKNEDRGEVARCDLKSGVCERLFETNAEKNVSYSDGGFDPAAPSSFYTLGDVIVLVNDFKTHGFVLNPSEAYLLRLQRENYYAEFSRFPISLFPDAQGVPHLIFATAWNHLEIVNLATRQVLTADKSLIKEGAEERHIAFYQKHEEQNKLLWPSAYDYFYGKLLLSPDRKTFYSCGWAWGSYECHTVYDLADFLTNQRIKSTTLFQGEHLGRAACFVDSQTIAVPHHAMLDGDEDAPDEACWSILLLDLEGNELGKIVPNERWDLGAAELAYCHAKDCFYLFSEEIGLAVVARDGGIQLHESGITPQSYCEAQDAFLFHSGNQVSVYQVCAR